MGLEEGLGGVVESEGPDWGDQLIEIIPYLCFLLFELDHYGAEESDHGLWHVEEGSDQEGAEEEVYEEGSLVEDADENGVVSFATDFVGESDVEADDEKVAEDEGEDGGKAHADSEEFAFLCPPKVDDDDGSIE